MLHLRRACTAAVLSLVLVAPVARAGAIQVDFDLTGSAVSFLDGILSVPPDGAITAASARIRVPGSSESEPEAGAAQLEQLSLSATLDGTVGGAVQLTGSFAGEQVGGGDGTLAGDLASLAVASLTLSLDGTIDCTGGQCLSIGDFPISVEDQIEMLANIALGLGDLGSPGNATLSGELALNLSGNQTVVTLAGVETSRLFVPEPATGWLLGLGLLAAARARRG